MSPTPERETDTPTANRHEEMAELLDDPGLHVSVGGEPASLPELRQRYQRQVGGRSPDVPSSG